MGAGNDTAWIRVEISPDRMSAELVVPGGFDLSAITPDLCLAAAREAGVAGRVDLDGALAKLMAEPRANHERREKIATGISPTHGKPGFIEWTVDAEMAKPDTDEP